jgi:hypothetical protein
MVIVIIILMGEMRAGTVGIVEQNGLYINNNLKRRKP